MIHPTADVQSTNIGEGTSVWQFSIVLPLARIGKDCNVNCHCFIENDVVIGDSTTIKSGVYIWDGVRIGSSVFIGPNVTFTNDLMPRSKKYPDRFVETRIEDFASIGANVTLVAGVIVGEGAMIGAGSVVTKNVPPYTLWYGNPAKQRGYVCRCGHRLNDDLICSDCGLRYETDTEGKLSIKG
jgi:acetyltransferase-like isoleucine patch superfamily enzyme